MDGNTDGPIPLQKQTQQEAVRENLQVRSFTRRMQICGGGTAPGSIALRKLKTSEPHLRGSVEIVIGTIARSRACLEQLIYERMHGPAVLHGQGSRLSVIPSVASLVAL